MKWTGGCLCGGIRYECDEDPVSAGTCHCRICKKWTGAAYNSIAGFPVSGLRFTKGQPKIYTGAVTIKELGFCADCGSPIWDRYLVQLNEGDPFGPDTVWIPIGTLDEPERVTLEFHYGVETQLPWVHFDDALPRTRCDEDPGLAAAFEVVKSRNFESKA